MEENSAMVYAARIAYVVGTGFASCRKSMTAKESSENAHERSSKLEEKRHNRVVSVRHTFFFPEGTENGACGCTR